MKVHNSSGLAFPTQNVNYGWKTFARTVNIYSTYTNVPVIVFTCTGGYPTVNLNGRATEVAFPTANQTEISYRNWAFSGELNAPANTGEVRVWTNSSSNGNGPILSLGSPFTQTAAPTLNNPSTGNVNFTFYARSKDYNTTHCWQYTMFCQDWSKITVTYP